MLHFPHVKTICIFASEVDAGGVGGVAENGRTTMEVRWNLVDDVGIARSSVRRNIWQLYLVDGGGELGEAESVHPYPDGNVNFQVLDDVRRSTSQKQFKTDLGTLFFYCFLAFTRNL